MKNSDSLKLIHIVFPLLLLTFCKSNAQMDGQVPITKRLLRSGQSTSVSFNSSPSRSLTSEFTCVDDAEAARTTVARPQKFGIVLVAGSSLLLKTGINRDYTPRLLQLDCAGRGQPLSSDAKSSEEPVVDENMDTVQLKAVNASSAYFKANAEGKGRQYTRIRCEKSIDLAKWFFDCPVCQRTAAVSMVAGSKILMKNDPEAEQFSYEPPQRYRRDFIRFECH